MARRSNFIGHTLERARWQPQRQMVALGALGFFVALILGALYLSQVASEATTNRRLVDLLALRDELEHTNEQLRVEIAEVQSIPNLQARAINLGFVIARPEQIKYLPVTGYVPDNPDTVAPIESEETELPVYDETFAGWLQQQWDQLMKSIGGG